VEGIKVWRRVLLWFQRGRNRPRKGNGFKYCCVLDNSHCGHIQGDTILHQHPGRFGGSHRLATAVALICRGASGCPTALHSLLVL